MLSLAGRVREAAARHQLFLVNIGVSAGLSGLGDLLQQRLETARATVPPHQTAG
jgi:hypothetical protein